MKTLGQLASQFGQLAAGGYKNNLRPILDLMGSSVKAEVQIEIGEYQSGVGPYPATAQLADATLDRKAKSGEGKGGNPDTPLWATGEYHDTIDYAKDVNSLSVEIGSNLDYVKYLELGTADMPPRPVFGPATLRAVPKIMPQIAAAAVVGMSGGVWSGLGVKGVTHSGGNDTATLMP